MAFLSVVDMRGMSKPFEVEEISSMELAAGDPGAELINTWPRSISGIRQTTNKKTRMIFLTNDMTYDFKERTGEFIVKPYSEGCPRYPLNDRH